MATTKNIHADPFNGEEKLFLNEFVSILNNVEHVSISDNDMFIYVHEKSHCYNICKIPTGTNCRNNKKCLRQKVLAKIEAKGGKSCVC
jgi:hypothetical protein